MRIQIKCHIRAKPSSNIVLELPQSSEPVFDEEMTRCERGIYRTFKIMFLLYAFEFSFFVVAVNCLKKLKNSGILD